MPTYYARKTGNVNATDVWATTPTGTAAAVTLTASDVLVSNSFTVTINVNTTVAEIRNDNIGGATAGGTFTLLAAGVSLTANIISGHTTQAATASPSGGATISVTGNIQGGAAGYGIDVGGSGTLNVVGNITGGSATNIYGLRFTGSGVVNVTGSVTGATASGIFVSGTGTVNVTGDVTGGSGATAGTGITCNSSATVNVFGTATGGGQANGVTGQSTGPINVTRARGNGFGNGSVGIVAAVGVASAQASTTRVSEFEFGDLGQSPVSGPILVNDSTSNVVLLYRPSLTKKTLTDPAATIAFPSPANVRQGVSYNSGSQVGTLAVPLASQVALGVAVDNTTGTAILTQANVETALGSFSSGRLSNCATVASTGQQLADALNGA